LVLVREGKATEAEQLLRTSLHGSAWMLGSYYADEDLGPVLKGREFAGFRRDFPPPADNPKPTR
jgi:hypothetical protein